MRIQTSLHGRLVGLGPAEYGMDPPLIVRGGLIQGEHGNQIVSPGPKHIVFFDDFLGDALADNWTIVEGTDAATSDAAPLAGGIGGVCRITSGDAGTGLAADLIGILPGILGWQAENGDLAMQVRIKPSAITTCYLWAGFTDVATLEAPIISAGAADTLTTTATDACGWMFDTRMATDNWWLTGVAGDADATAQNSGYAPSADDYETLRVELDTSGTANFFRNGKQVGQRMTGAVTPATDLVPVLYCGKISVAASMFLDCDYFYAQMRRAADGGAV